MSIDPKPRVQIDFKTVMFIMAFFGLGTWAGVFTYIKKAGWLVVEAPVRAVVAEEQAKATERILQEIRGRFGRVDDILEELPGGRAAAKRVREKEIRKREYGYHPNNSDIRVF